MTSKGDILLRLLSEIRFWEIQEDNEKYKERIEGIKDAIYVVLSCHVWEETNLVHYFFDILRISNKCHSNMESLKSEIESTLNVKIDNIEDTDLGDILHWMVNVYEAPEYELARNEYALLNMAEDTNKVPWQIGVDKIIAFLMKNGYFDNLKAHIKISDVLENCEGIENVNDEWKWLREKIEKYEYYRDEDEMYD